MCVISVIVPVYQVERDVERCIDSILAQSLRDFELLLVNDGSPDRSGELCLAAARRDERIRYFEKPNGGLASARNFGMERARGEYLCFVDSDDFIEPDCLAFCLERARETGADVVLCGYLMENGKGVREIKSAPAILAAGNLNTRMQELKTKNLIDPAWNKLYRRAFVEQNVLRFPEGELYEDTDFNLRLLACKPKIALYDRCFYHYVLHMGSITRRYNPEKLATIKRRALLLREVTAGIEPYCDYYYIKSVFSAIMDMFLSCERREIKRVIAAELDGADFRRAASGAAAPGRAAAVTIAAAKSGSPTRVYRFCRLAYFLKFKMQKLFLRVRP